MRHDLTGTACTGHEQRIEVDIVFETVERRVTAEIKNCPRCHTRTKGSFPDTMPGPLQYGPGIVAYVVHLLCAQMVPLKRTAAHDPGDDRTGCSPRPPCSPSSRACIRPWNPGRLPHRQDP